MGKLRLMNRGASIACCGSMANSTMLRNTWAIAWTWASPPGVPPGANFALSAKVLKRFLDQHGVVYETRNVGAILTPGEAASRARSATVRVGCRNSSSIRGFRLRGE